MRNTDDRRYRFTAGVACSGAQISELLQADDRGDRFDEDDLAESILSCRREWLCQLRTQLPQGRAAFLGMQRAISSASAISPDTHPPHRPRMLSLLEGSWERIAARTR